MSEVDFGYTVEKTELTHQDELTKTRLFWFLCALHNRVYEPLCCALLILSSSSFHNARLL